MTRLLQWGLFFSSTMNLLALTVERYLGIVHPFTYDRYVTRRRTKVLIVVEWIFGSVLSGAALVPSSGMVDGGKTCTTYSIFPSLLAWRVYGASWFIINMIIPVVIIVYSYGRILLFLHKNERTMSDFSNRERDAKARQARNNVLRTCFIVAVCYFICWAPNVIHFFVYNLGVRVSFTTPLYHLTAIMVYLNGCINPVIYAAQFKQFQTGFLELVCRCRRSRSEGDNDNSTASRTNTKETHVSSVSSSVAEQA